MGLYPVMMDLAVVYCVALCVQSDKPAVGKGWRSEMDAAAPEVV